MRESGWLMNRFGRHPATPTQVTSGQMGSVFPVFSPDGKTLYVIGQEPRGELQHLDKRSVQFVPYMAGLSAKMADFSRDGNGLLTSLSPKVLCGEAGSTAASVCS